MKSGPGQTGGRVPCERAGLRPGLAQRARHGRHGRDSHFSSAPESDRRRRLLQFVSGSAVFGLAGFLPPEASVAAPFGGTARVASGEAAWSPDAGSSSGQSEKAVAAYAASLLGYWFAVSPDPTRARVLRITDVLFVEDTTALLAGVYGPASAPFWPEASEINLRQSGRNWLLDVTAKDEPGLALASQADGSLRGALVGANGGKTKLRFLRASLPEIHAYAAQQPLPALRAGRDSRIELVYIGAHDCSMCRQWEDIHLGLHQGKPGRGGRVEQVDTHPEEQEDTHLVGKGRLTGSPLWSQIDFTAVRLASLRKPFAIDDAPRRLHPVLNDMLAHGVRVRGVPSFLLLVDGHLRAHALGPAAFDSLLLPALRAAVREKFAA